MTNRQQDDANSPDALCAELAALFLAPLLDLAARAAEADTITAATRAAAEETAMAFAVMVYDMTESAIQVRAIGERSGRGTNDE